MCWMPKAGLLFHLLFLAMLKPAQAQDFGQAFRTGNVRLIASSFSQNVEMNILGEEGLYSKAQAVQILKDFMQRNPPQRFVQRHLGVGRDGNQYLIGTFESQGGQFRAYLYIQHIGTQSFVREIRIERER